LLTVVQPHTRALTDSVPSAGISRPQSAADLPVGAASGVGGCGSEGGAASTAAAGALHRPPWPWRASSQPLRQLRSGTCGRTRRRRSRHGPPGQQGAPAPAPPARCRAHPAPQHTHT
jgi:hypothetical protein